MFKVTLKTTALAPWFSVLLNKATEEVLNSLHVLVILTIFRISAPNAD